MSSAALQRQAALAGAALLAALLVLVLGRPSPAPTAVGSPPPVSAASWEEADISDCAGEGGRCMRRQAGGPMCGASLIRFYPAA